MRITITALYNVALVYAAARGVHHRTIGDVYTKKLGT